uniref:Uncharacterized protein n=1 Tax=Solanum lycopersicum TaxID=4081 RepID=K4CU86_SOLLC
MKFEGQKAVLKVLKHICSDGKWVLIDEIMEVNILAFIATAQFIPVPTAFLLIIYVKTVSQND